MVTNASKAWRFFELKEIGIPYFLFGRTGKTGKAYHHRSVKLKILALIESTLCNRLRFHDGISGSEG
jgi:hypothetical protein